jgi:hypothetical protein
VQGTAKLREQVMMAKADKEEVERQNRMAQMQWSA